MTDLKTAFSALEPLEWSDIPKDDLATFLKENFIQAELIANSVPLPPSTDTTNARASSTKTAASAAETLVTAQPNELDLKNVELQKVWGKPIKINAKDNPLNVSVYKAAGHDRRGAWFARRSVHTGLSYEKWQSAMQREFATSLKVKKGPGSGAVRGIAGDKRLEKLSAEGTGDVEGKPFSAL